MISVAGLNVSPLCLGGNVFGWTANKEESYAVLDAYVAGGGNFIDTADGYSHWVPGNSGGDSEKILGEWMADRGNRADLVIATKVGMWPVHKGLSAANIRAAVEGSLSRLKTDYIDLYYAHVDDPEVAQEETVAAFAELVAEGKVRALGASNYSPERLASALDIADATGVPGYAVYQGLYSLMEREYETTMEPLLRERNVAMLPYYSLAKGFLTGKYRTADAENVSVRSDAAKAYLDVERGPKTLAVLDDVAAAHNVPVATIALAWLSAQPTVATPIASARTVGQLEALIALNDVTLSSDEVAALTAASA